MIHLATHGFFLGSNCETAPRDTRSVGGLVSAVPVRAQIENPLLLSGLALAGANRRNSTGSGEDGILTAEEVGALDLGGIEWAVLSACDTGLGEIRAGEGVFGLRRAFQVAGVRTVIMSLWSVQDEATRRWMRALYENRFQNGADTATAMRNASLAVLRERRAAGQNTHPFYWAAFIAAGDWR
jgi:CHAT domain-containing protein